MSVGIGGSQKVDLRSPRPALICVPRGSGIAFHRAGTGERAPRGRAHVYDAGRAGIAGPPKRNLHQRRGRAPKTPTLLDVLGVRGKLKLQNHERALPRVLDSKLRVTASPTRIVGGGAMSKRNLIIEEGSVEAMARLQKQDEEFCRRLRAAIETGRERCPTTVFTEACTNRPVSNYMRPD